jgi:hypothetical protein
MRGVEYRATWAQLKLGAEVGVMRTLSAIMNNRASRGVNTSDLKRKHCETYTDNIIGAQAELITAQHYNLFWDGRLGDLEAADVGGLLQVRGSTRLDHDLCLHEWDNDDDPYVSVLVDGDRFVLHGWFFGHEGKRTKFWRDGAKGWPAFWVPRELLHDLDDLSRWVEVIGKRRDDREVA